MELTFEEPKYLPGLYSIEARKDSLSTNWKRLDVHSLTTRNSFFTDFNQRGWNQPAVENVSKVEALWRFVDSDGGKAEGVVTLS